MIETKCSYYNAASCLSCELMEAGDDSARVKEDLLAKLFEREGFGELKIDPIIKPKDNFHSRSRVKLLVSGTAENPTIGLLDEQFEGIELLDCPLHLPKLNPLLHFIRELIIRERLHPYDIKSKTGELKGLMILSNRESSEILLRFILRSRSLEKRVCRLVPEIQKLFPEVKVVSINLQPIAHAVFEGPEEILLTEQSKIFEKYFNRKFAIAPQSFMQVTPEIAEQLYKSAAKLGEGRKSFLDLFCGIGGFSVFLGEKAEWGIGVELSEQAIDCAQEGAKLNGLKNVKFIAADVLAYLRNFSGVLPELILVNPPRRGLFEEIIVELKRLKPTQILYSSCNSETLIRDLKSLKSDYKLERVVPFDMFPLTRHVEVLVSLVRN